MALIACRMGQGHQKPGLTGMLGQACYTGK
jgi:hypothetical protein